MRVREWWCKRYNLPPNDARLLDQSLPELTQQMIEGQLQRRSEIKWLLENQEDGSDNAALYKELNALNEFLGFPADVQDDLFDKWERELAEGKMPDLDEMPE